MEEIVAKTKKEERLRHLKELRKSECFRDIARDKARAETEEQIIPHSQSRIFRGLKIIGLVSNHIPCVLRYVHTRRENFVVTSIGKSFNTYASNQLSMLSQSSALDSEISCMAGDTYHIYTGSKNKIYAWRRGVEIVHEYQGGHDSTVAFILPFGQHLISIDESGVMCMRDIRTEKLISSVHLDQKSFNVSSIMHPATYINKILLGSHQGTLQLWNVKKMKMIHLFSHWTDSSILSVVQAPAIDCVAIVLSGKRIVIHNLRYDITVMSLKCEDQPVSVGFRTDNVETMVSGSSSGSITLWDLNTQEVLQHVVHCHSEPVNGLQCMHQEPLFFTSSADNTLKVWIFDGPGGTFRELNCRSGHSKPPGRVRFFGKSGYEILSASRDGRIRQFHVHKETINRAWGENKIPGNVVRNRTEKPNRIVDFTSASVAQISHHDDIAVLTEDEAAVTTWSSIAFKQGTNVLFPLKRKIAHVDFIATCLYLTSCGQFVVVGYDNGAVHRYNIQSGLHRLEYCCSPDEKAHDGAVRGVSVDSHNAYIASGGSDYCLKLWKFGSSEIVKDFVLSAGIASFFRHRKTNLLGVTLDNFEIIVMCFGSLTILREFRNVNSPVEDALFSPDNRWLTASSSDCLVRTWDLPTNNMIDIFRVESIVTYMDYSNNGQILATALNNNVGILLWSNKTLFKFVSLLPIPLDYEPPVIVSNKNQPTTISGTKSQFTGYNYDSPEDLENGLVTFSKAPEAKWKTLLHLDIIRERNKPKEAPKKHMAPFFIPSELKVSSNEDPFGVKQQNDVGTIDKGSATPTSGSKILSINFTLSPFASGLLENSEDESYPDNLCKMLENMSPFQIEAEIIALGPAAGGSPQLLQAFIVFIKDVLESKRHFDTAHSVLNLFLKTHLGEIVSDGQFREERETLRKSLLNSMEGFHNLTYEINGFCDFILGTS